MSTDLTEVITESLEDATMPQEETSEVEVDSTPTESVEAAPEAANEPTEDLSDGSPATRQAQPKAVDEFEKKFGIPSQSVTGRENRIPYSRVKKIVEKREKELQTQYEGEYKPKLTEYETKVKDYEERLTKVGEFEHVLMNEPEKMLQILASIPAYAKYFQAQEQAQAAAPVAQAQAQVDDAMPQPTDKYGDGNYYNMDGLKALLEWNARQVEAKVSKQYDEKFSQYEQQISPIKNAWEYEQYMAKVVPQVNAQITEARTWPLFNENEAEIVKALDADRRLSLEGAYRRVVFPKFQAERDKIRQEVIKDLQKAPVATSAPVRPSRPAPISQSKGPRDLESVISEAIQVLK